MFSCWGCCGTPHSSWVKPVIHKHRRWPITLLLGVKVSTAPGPSACGPLVECCINRVQSLFLRQQIWCLLRNNTSHVPEEQIPFSHNPRPHGPSSSFSSPVSAAPTPPPPSSSHLPSPATSHFPPSAANNPGRDSRAQPESCGTAVTC